MARVTVTPNVVQPGGDITIRVECYDGPRKRFNLQLECLRAELARDQLGFMMGFETETSENFEFVVQVPNGIAAGPYFLAGLRAAEIAEPSIARGPQAQRPILSPTQNLEGLAFFVGEATPSHSAVQQILDLHHRRQARIQARVETGPTPHQPRLQVAYLYTDLLIHAPQHCEGYSIIPYGPGLSPTSALVGVNAFAKLAFAAVFNVTKEQVDDYARNKPLAAIVFHNVGAATAQDAMQGIRPLVDDVALEQFPINLYHSRRP